MAQSIPQGSDSIPAWDHPATIRPRGVTGIRADFSDLQHGTLAAMVYIASHFHKEELERLVVQITGGRRIEPYEILSLSRRPDFPGAASIGA